MKLIHKKIASPNQNIWHFAGLNQWHIEWVYIIKLCEIPTFLYPRQECHQRSKPLKPCGTCDQQLTLDPLFHDWSILSFSLSTTIIKTKISKITHTFSEAKQQTNRWFTFRRLHNVRKSTTDDEDEDETPIWASEFVKFVDFLDLNPSKPGLLARTETRRRFGTSLGKSGLAEVRMKKAGGRRRRRGRLRGGAQWVDELTAIFVWELPKQNYFEIGGMKFVFIFGVSRFCWFCVI